MRNRLLRRHGRFIPVYVGMAVIFLLGVMPRSTNAQSGARSARPLRVAYLSTSATMASVWMARESGALGREGLETEVISMPSSTAIPALIANEIDVVQVSAAPVITASVRGLDVVFIAGLLNTMIWDFYVRPEIKNTEELRGKIVGTDRPGTPVAYGTLVALKKLGFTAKDVQLRALGSSPAIVAAFYAGQIAGGVGSPPASFQMERSGFRSVVSLLDVPYQNVGLVVRRSRLDELAERLLPMLRAVRAGIERYYADKPFAMKVIGKYTKETDQEVLDRTYEFYKRAGFRREMVTSEPGLQGMLDFLSETIPGAKGAKPAQFFDDRFVRRINSGK
ncbi:MAG TPA: ABC transporter substrate-binding protein [Verrucomicrobiae bacterium]|nr:ABC transporter substrate-binding protein [Verrucomicrobiae bacterium]